jgi:hypothetical protein
MTTKYALLVLTVPLALSACSKTDSATSTDSGSKSDLGSGDAAVVQCIKVADDLIADFKTDNGLNPVDGRQGGFYVYGDGSLAGQFDPAVVKGQAYPTDTSTGNSACSGPGSFHVKASGWGVWGAALGADFMPKILTDALVGPDLQGYKGTYDASKYKGISFWAKASAPLTRVQVSFPDAYTDGGATFEGLPDASEAPNGLTSCVYAPDPTSQCSPYLVKFGSDAAYFPAYQDYQIDTTWKRFEVLFADTRQDQYVKGFHASTDPVKSTRLDTRHLTAMAIQVNANYVNNAASPNDFEIWVDDVNFIK